MNIKIETWHKHHEVKIDDKVYIRFNANSWFEKIYGEYNPITSMKMEIKLEKIFEEYK